MESSVEQPHRRFETRQERRALFRQREVDVWSSGVSIEKGTFHVSTTEIGILTSDNVFKVLSERIERRNQQKKDRVQSQVDIEKRVALKHKQREEATAI